jgi:hypothetical protein
VQDLGAGDEVELGEREDAVAVEGWKEKSKPSSVFGGLSLAVFSATAMRRASRLACSSGAGIAPCLRCLRRLYFRGAPCVPDRVATPKWEMRSLLLEALDESSAAYLIIRYWTPPIISIVLGGLFASILFPRWQNNYARVKSLTEHRIALVESIAVQFAAYTTGWRRLIQISTLEAERALTEQEAARKADFVAERNKARDALCASFARGQLHFTEKACGVIKKFMEWDEAQATKPLSDLPSVKEWREWEARLLAQLKRDEQATGSWRR